MEKFKGKKLLVLGSNVGSVDIVKYARKNGAFVYVADYFPKKKSLAKLFADKAVQVSTADIGELGKLIEQEKIDGVLAGVSEFNLLNAMKLCELFELPFYCTRNQWDSIENKELFRKLCMEFNVPCPFTYYTGSQLPDGISGSINYPVIVKPVDSSSSNGISICRDIKALVLAIPEAIRNSEKGRFIIEEFFAGEEFTAHYTIANGQVSLSCVDNRVPVAIHDGDVTTIPVARIYPSSFIDDYIRQVDDKMKILCESLNLDTGVMFIQGLYNSKENSFSIFEAGLRCAGEAPYRFIERINGISFMNNLVDYALLGETKDFDASKEDPYFGGKICCVTSFVSKGGRIGKIINYEETAHTLKSIVDSECRYHEGDETPNGNTLRQIVIRFVLICDSQAQLVRDIEYINNSVKVLDVNGNDMCLTFNTRSFYSK